MYPPSLVQLGLVLSGIESRKLEHCAPLRGIPGVIVLHEISAYFQTPETVHGQPRLISSYLSAIVSAISACSPREGCESEKPTA
ncbi:hypothetical protein M378DRAFT_158873 [Amanita muscaria Koide BX008]|uniref:Uncharacterized protein n=1 Tax=Amanita muscaria (strain Koide BX008) TaxID=946122 RepID=A0A0C2X2F9_AMAMK|nr:hypothetical protein M378DRAFT_158873 [Amanita muscaria Koide BX008]